MIANRGAVALVLLAGAVACLPGCMTKPLRSVAADGTYCYRVNDKNRHHTCTAEPVPANVVEAEAKRFEASQDAFTLYVVRKRWLDASNRVVVSLDGQARVTTIPDSIVRIRLRPGEHHLMAEWDGKKAERSVAGAAGEVRFVELVGQAWTWGADYRWEAGTQQVSQSRAVTAKLVADVDAR